MLLRGLTWLVLFQLLGTALNVLFLTLLPGPIIGMLLLFAVLSALPIVLTLRLVEPALVLPALSLVLFAEAAMAALAARVIRVRASAANLTLWDSPVRSPLWGVQRRSSASRTKRRCSSKNRRRFVQHHDRNPRPGPSGSHKLRCRTGTQ